jgi:GrpB-like predicted nucleotidyltransferase (UPF0157 family)
MPEAVETVDGDDWKNQVVVVDADPAWPSYFERIADYLTPFIDDAVMRIEHVGSTSVPELAAKPIIDIDVVVATEEEIPEVIEMIRSAGYRWIGTMNVEGREAFDAPLVPQLPDHHLYLVVENNRAHSDHWLFRDALRSDASTRDRYGELKRRNADLVRGDGDRYTALKARFVAEVLAEARRSRAMDPVEYWEPELD